MIKIAVLVSGSGSNLQALIDANLSGQIVGVISNKPEVYALQRAEKAGIQTAVIEQVCQSMGRENAQYSPFSLAELQRHAYPSTCFKHR